MPVQNAATRALGTFLVARATDEARQRLLPGAMEARQATLRADAEALQSW